jgi:hypothetical protein
LQPIQEVTARRPRSCPEIASDNTNLKQYCYARGVSGGTEFRRISPKEGQSRHLFVMDFNPSAKLKRTDQLGLAGYRFCSHGSHKGIECPTCRLITPYLNTLSNGAAIGTNRDVHRNIVFLLLLVKAEDRLQLDHRNSLA